MKLAAPVYSLKRLAKDLSREKRIPLHAALNRVAQDEGFTSWGLLAARLSAEGPAGVEKRRSGSSSLRVTASPSVRV
jgi:hypothetical protein